MQTRTETDTRIHHSLHQRCEMSSVLITVLGNLAVIAVLIGLVLCRQESWL